MIDVATVFTGKEKIGELTSQQSITECGMDMKL